MASAAFGGDSRAWPLRRRRDLEVCALEYERRRVWGLKDPVALRYFQLEEEEFWIFERLDGRFGLKQIQADFERTFAPKRLDLQMLQAFVRQLHGEGLILSDAPGQGSVLTRRHSETRRRERAAKWLNPLVIRFRGFDPERILNQVYPEVRWLFSRAAALVYTLLVGAALLLVATHWREVMARLPSPEDFFQPRNAIWFAAAIGLTKLLHELGHALVCKRYGGECHEMGVMLFLFSPSLYCNVSDTWMLRDKWARIAVSAAGIGVELLIAAVTTFLWWFTEPGLVNTLALAMMFVCTVNTLALNGNPLMRYDGYHALADFVEIPHLAQAAGDVWRRWAARLWFGREPGRADEERTPPSTFRTGALATYAAASTIYLWFVMFGALRMLNVWAATYGLQLAAQALTVLAVAGIVAGPAMRVGRRLTAPNINGRLRRPRFWIATVVVLAVVATVLLVPIPRTITVEAVLRPAGAKTVCVTQPGLLEWITAEKQVEEGEVVAILRDDELKREVLRLETERSRRASSLANLEKRQQADPTANVDLPTARQALEEAQEKLEQRSNDQRRLTLKAPIAGTAMAAPARFDERRDPRMLAEWSGLVGARENLGALLEAGTPVCVVGNPRRIEATAMIEQTDVLAIRPKCTVELLIDAGGGDSGGGSRSDSTWAGTVIHGVVREVAQHEWNSHDEASAGERRSEARGPRSATTKYQVQITIDGEVDGATFDAPVPAKIRVDAESLGATIARRLAQTFRFE